MGRRTSGGGSVSRCGGKVAAVWGGAGKVAARREDAREKGQTGGFRGAACLKN